MNVNKMADQKKTHESKKPKMRRRWPWAIALAFIYAVALGAYAFTVYINRKNGYSQWVYHGQFGDSFGAANALISAFALAGVFVAVYFQREELYEQRAESKRGEVESRFFQLLQSLQGITNATRVGTYEGRQAIRKLAERLSTDPHLLRPPTPENCDVELLRDEVKKWYAIFFEGIPNELDPAMDQLGHYFRLIYHIVRYLDESAAISPDDRAFYIRILRSHFSNPELILMFYNGVSVYGNEYFKPLIEKYKLLKNLNPGSLSRPQDGLLYERC
jgi:hypothetical protein